MSLGSRKTPPGPRRIVEPLVAEALVRPSSNTRAVTGSWLKTIGPAADRRKRRQAVRRCASVCISLVSDSPSDLLTGPAKGPA